MRQNNTQLLYLGPDPHQPEDPAWAWNGHPHHLQRLVLVVKQIMGHLLQFGFTEARLPVVCRQDFILTFKL